MKLKAIHSYLLKNKVLPKMSSSSDKYQRWEQLIKQKEAFLKGFLLGVSEEDRKGVEKGLQLASYMYEEFIVSELATQMNDDINGILDYVKGNFTEEASLSICAMPTDDERKKGFRNLFTGLNVQVHTQFKNLSKSLLSQKTWFSLNPAKND
jgi:hypothetical protein